MNSTTDPTAVPDTIIGVSFADRFRATEFVTAIGRLASRHELTLKDVVMVAKDVDGSTRVEETLDPSIGRAAVSGAMWAGLIGLLIGGPVGWLAGGAVGAGVGAATARVVDLGVPDEWVKWFRDAVKPSTVTVVLLAADVHPDALVAEVERFVGAHLVHANLSPGLMERVRSALHDVEA
jgi:uncharacterized membrane protein